MTRVLQLLALSRLALCSGYSLTAACPPSRIHMPVPALACSPYMQLADEAAPPEGAAVQPAAEADASAADDFTEDLLDALAADETPMGEVDSSMPAVFVKSDNPAEMLDPRVAYVNEQAVEALRTKYKLHANDVGSAQVQIAVLTARIQYMTTHMQQNKKDYASLRGLTRMVTRRRKLLEYLLKHDLPEFKRITAELGIRTNQLLKPKLGGARGRRV
jgi:small subunit ribosomal protein S15